MKKSIVILCVVALVVALATAAMATETNWVIKFKAGALSGTTLTNATGITIGASATASTSGAAAIGNNKGNLAAFVGTNMYSTQRVASAAGANAPYTFNIVLAQGTLFVGNMYISAFAPDKYGTPVPAAGWDLPANYQVVVRQGEEVLATWTQAQLRVASDPTNAGPVGFWYTTKGASDSYGGSLDIFTVTVENVPEPGSFVALGSGLMGLAGFAIRRRRA